MANLAVNKKLLNDYPEKFTFLSCVLPHQQSVEVVLFNYNLLTCYTKLHKFTVRENAKLINNFKEFKFNGTHEQPI